MNCTTAAPVPVPTGRWTACQALTWRAEAGQAGGGVEAVVLAAMAVPGRMPVTAAATAVTAVVARAVLRMPLLCRMLSSP